jgi:hypothetical protein
MMSCRLFYYYDLVTSLALDLAAAYASDGNMVNYPVHAGDVIGKIGGQTLDFAVWDTDKPLTGFIVPEHYDGEAWKRYTADPLDYYTDEVKTAALEKYLRVAEPRSGKIDYDVDGMLIGNWFLQNADGTTNGYAGGATEEYWDTHLSFAPDYLDPAGFGISIGNWPGGAAQFAEKDNAPDPAAVGVETGLVKYDLVQANYKVGDAFWDRATLQQPIALAPGDSVLGCMLVQLTDTRVLKAEAFKDTVCAAVGGFDAAALTYVR